MTDTNPTDPKAAKADAAAAKAKAKALRPWFKKKRFIIPIAILAIIIVANVANAGGGSSSNTADSSSSSETTTEETKTEESKDAGLNTPVVDGKFTFTVTGFECGIPSVGSDMLGETAQGQFCRVGLVVENTGNEPQYMFADNQKAFDAEGREFSPSTSAMIYDGDAGAAWMTEINPGNSITGSLLFDIPAGATLTSIELHDSAFSGGVKVSLQ